MSVQRECGLVVQYLSRIGELFFHLPSQRPKMSGLFGNSFNNVYVCENFGFKKLANMKFNPDLSLIHI